MATSATTPDRQAPRGARPMSQVERARVTLLGTSAIIGTVLLAWLLLTPLFRPPTRPPTLLAAALGAPDTLPGTTMTLADGARRLAALSRSSTPATLGRRDFERALAAFLDPEGSRSASAVVNLGAVGVTAPADAEGSRAFLLTTEGGFAPGQGLISAADLLARLRGKKAPPTLLILDAAQPGSDRELGVFGDGFLAQLAPLLKRDGNLVVLSACAPAQLGWASEADGRTVFARAVAEGLAGRAAQWGRITVKSLHRQVSAEVSRWAAAHRAAIQTPVLLGNDSLDFPLARLEGTPAAPEPDPRIAEMRKALALAWAERAALAGSAPYRHAPLLWRRYQGALLRAERLLRAGDPAGAEKALDAAAKDLKPRVVALARGPEPPPPHALALEADAARVAAYRAAIDRAFTPPADPSPTPPTPEPEPAPPPPEDTPEPAPKPDPKDPAKDKPRPKADPAAPRPLRRTKPVKFARADPPAAPAAEPVPVAEALTGGDPAAPPSYVEGELALWYTTFVAEGGETKALRPRRQELLRQASETLAKAEQAASPDPRALAWARELVDQGDDLRRQAQDQLFAGAADDAKGADVFKGVPALLSRAEVLYQRALDSAARARQAADLVQRLQDELPSYGEWRATRPDGPDGPDESFEALMEQGARIAQLLDEGPGPEAKADGRRRELATLTENAGRGLAALGAEFDAAVTRAAAATSSPSWRELDALLRVPRIAPEDRSTLLDRAAAPEDPSDSADRPADPAKADPDPISWNRARGLARLEWGLLKLGGQDVRELAEWQAEAWAARDKNPDRAFDALDRFSAGVRSLRKALAAGRAAPAPGDDHAPEGAAEPAADEREGHEPALDRLRKDFAAADRAARALTASDLADLVDDPTHDLDKFRLHDLLVWHARRLDDDFAPKHARRLLEAARQLGGSRELLEEFDRAHKRDEAALVVRGPATGRLDAQGQELPLSVTAEGDVPPGRATLMLAHDPASTLEAAVSGDSSLIAVPPPDPGRPTERTLVVGRREHTRRAVPTAFFRGHAFGAEGVQVAEEGDLVKVEIRQKSTLKNLRDQFDMHPGEGFLHPNNSLEYKLVVTNQTARPLDAFVTYTLDGEVAKEGRLALAPTKAGAKRADESLTGDVRPNYLDAIKPKFLTITVNEGGPDGRPLCRPVKIPFRLVNPQDFVKAEPGLYGRIFFVRVTHVAATDPVPVPIKVTVLIQPGNAIQEIVAKNGQGNIKTIPHGYHRDFNFRIIQPITKLTYTVNAEGVDDVFTKTFVLEQPGGGGAGGGGANANPEADDMPPGAKGEP